jgi:hypothetical protein
MQAATGGDVSLRSAAMNVGLGTVGGGLVGGVAHGIKGLTGAQQAVAGGYTPHPAAEGMVLKDAAGQAITIPDELAQEIQRSALTGAGFGAGAGATSGITAGTGVSGGAELAEQTGVAAATGALEGYAATQAQRAAVQQAMSEASSQAAGIRPGGASVFAGKLPDNPFYDPVEDLISAGQEGAL